MSNNISLTYNYDNEDNYFFDPDKIEIVGGVAKLKPIVIGAEAYIYAKLDDNQGLVAIDSSGNNRHGAFQGGLDEGDWTTGKINSAVEGIGTTGGFINFNQYGNFTRTQAFSLECWFKYTSTDSQSIISKQSNVGNFEGYAIAVLTGKLRAVIRDDAGNRIVIETAGTYNDGNWHHIVMSYDGSSVIGGVNFYVDNVLDEVIILSETLTGSIGTTANLQVSGRDGNNNTLDIGSVVDEVVIYARELTAAEVAFRWNTGNGTQELPGASTTFSTDNPTIRAKGTFTATQLLIFDATVIETGADTIEFIVIAKGVQKYWNGFDWVDSTGYPESNRLTEIAANIDLLDLDDGGSINLICTLHSDDGSTTPEIDDYSFEFDFIGFDPVLIKNTVFGNIFELSGVPDVRTITVQTIDFVYGSTSIIVSDPIPVSLSNGTGFFTVDLFIEDTEPDRLRWKFGSKIIETNFLTGDNNFNDLTRY